MGEEVQCDQPIPPYPGVVHVWSNSSSSLRLVIQIAHLYWHKVSQLHHSGLHQLQQGSTETRQTTESTQLHFMSLEVDLWPIVLWGRWGLFVCKVDV